MSSPSAGWLPEWGPCCHPFLERPGGHCHSLLQIYRDGILFGWIRETEENPNITLSKKISDKNQPVASAGFFLLKPSAERNWDTCPLLVIGQCPPGPGGAADYSVAADLHIFSGCKDHIFHNNHESPLTPPDTTGPITLTSCPEEVLLETLSSQDLNLVPLSAEAEAPISMGPWTD